MDLVEFSGAYMMNCQVFPAAPHASDPAEAEQLWLLSERLVGQKFSY